MSFDATHLVLILVTAISGGISIYISRKNGKLQERLKQFEGHSSLQLAALERRLEVHQAAWTLCDDLASNLSDPVKLSDVAMKASAWFKTNNLYLEKRARQAFFDAHMAASQLSIDPETLRREDRDTWIAWRRDVLEARAHIARGVELPSLGESTEQYGNRLREETGNQSD